MMKVADCLPCCISAVLRAASEHVTEDSPKLIPRLADFFVLQFSSIFGFFYTIICLIFNGGVNW
jgi:hypothetical protein